ncbi:hypothetical protein ACOES3_00445 [Candidatus Phytoplasma citri]|uniref:Sequence-variable mosaic (SVM) signal sequence domain-containing protein n=1 Tax=Candidatus Phytoplasma citri TaxID=180978 RepID=A0ABU8ZRI3_9MOLU
MSFCSFLFLGLLCINNNKIMAMEKLNNKLIKETNINKCQKTNSTIQKIPKYSKKR